MTHANALSAEPSKRRLTHVITDLDTGGAEMMLYKLLASLDAERYECRVVSLMDHGDLGQKIADLGIEVEAIRMQRGRPRPSDLWRLARTVRATHPHLVQSWMYHADLMATLSRPWLAGTPLVWNVRQSDLDRHHSKASTRLTVRLCARLSRIGPRHIICCSEQARSIHVALGYCPKRFSVIPNGFDLSRFRPRASAREALREALGIPKGAPLVGMVCRFDPQKDIEGFLAAAGKVRQAIPSCRLLLCGRGLDRANTTLSGWLARHGLTEQCHLLGLRTDPERIFAALDVAVSSSAYGEGFPNAIGEAMACGVPAVVTDVGDSAALVGETGIVVPPRDRDALAGAIIQALSLESAERHRLGEQARARIEAELALPAIAQRYQALYDRLLEMT